jgi:hypothetical protein
MVVYGMLSSSVAPSVGALKDGSTLGHTATQHRVVVVLPQCLVSGRAAGDHHRIAAQSHPLMRSVPGTPALSPLFVLGGCHHAHLNVISFVDKLVALRSMQNAGRCTVDMAIPEYGHWFC